MTGKPDAKKSPGEKLDKDSQADALTFYMKEIRKIKPLTAGKHRDWNFFRIRGAKDELYMLGRFLKSLE